MVTDRCDYCGTPGCHWTRHGEAVREVAHEARPRSDEETWVPRYKPTS